MPIILLHDAEGGIVTVELKNGEVCRGVLDEAEDSMNLVLKVNTERPTTLSERLPANDLSMGGGLRMLFCRCLGGNYLHSECFVGATSTDHDRTRTYRHLNIFGAPGRCFDFIPCRE